MVVPSPTDVDCPNDIRLLSSFLNKKLPVLPIKALKVPLSANPKCVDFSIKPVKPDVLGVFTILPSALVIIVEDNDADVLVKAPDTLDSTVSMLVCKALDEAFKLADTELAFGKLPLTEAAVANPLQLT